MKGWLVYEAQNVQRNCFFIDRWMQAAKAETVDLRLVKTNELAYGIRRGDPFLLLSGQDEMPAFIVMRCNQPLLSRHAENMGIVVFNNSKVARICNDKRLTHSLLAGQVPMMDTAFLAPNAFYAPFPFPLVIKGVLGCGGREVYRADDSSQYQEALKAITPDHAVVQPLCDEPGRDMRVYVLGDKIIACMLRCSTADFRSNIGLGAASKPVDLPEQVREYVAIIQSHFSFGLAGIDFIFHQGQPVFNEIEDAVGTRMLYMHTGHDIAREYLALILGQLPGLSAALAHRLPDAL
jgi:gamma-F420-2:alpha-L-glutamate ligase